jgi:hypothetical protein
MRNERNVGDGNLAGGEQFVERRQSAAFGSTRRACDLQPEQRAVGLRCDQIGKRSPDIDPDSDRVGPAHRQRALGLPIDPAFAARARFGQRFTS